MRSAQRLAVAAVVCAALVVPEAARAANQPPVVDAVNFSHTPIPANTAVSVQCQAHDDDGTIVRMRVTVGAGTLPGGTNAQDVVITPGATVSGTILWTTPAAGSYTVTCGVRDSDMFPANGTLTVTAVVVDAAAPPAIDELTASETVVFPGTTVNLSAVARDPGGAPLTYLWSASGGALEPSSGPDAVWTAPSQLGTYVIGLEVDNGSARASATVGIEVVWARATRPWTAPGGRFFPTRLALDASGNLYAADSRNGSIVVFTPTGSWLRTLSLAARPTALAVDASGRVFVGDSATGGVAAFDASGRREFELGKGAGELAAPVGIALDPATGAVFVAEARGAEVHAYDSTGKLVRRFPAGGTPSGLAFDPVRGHLYVAVAGASRIAVFDGLGTQVRVLSRFGSRAGELTRLAGLALGPGSQVYGVDAFQGELAVFTTNGDFLATIGRHGREQGQLTMPLDAVIDARRNRVLVANADLARIEVFELPNAAPPVCAADTDCDGMPDDFEARFGFDPGSAADAFQDADGDGLANLDEHALGTDPRKADTDADGVNDGDERLAGFNPLDASDQLPVAAARGPGAIDPTLVALDGSGSTDPNGDPLRYLWRQLSGVPVTLSDSGAAAPHFVARRAGTYGFGLTVSDGKASSAEAVVQVEVRDVAPRADAGPDLGGRVGDPVLLDGRFSSDANGEALVFAWRQMGGASVSLSAADTAVAQFVAPAPGVYSFALTVRDGAHESEPDLVHVLVESTMDHVPVAAILDAPEGRVGEPVVLTGALSADADGDSLLYTWRQTGGPAIALGDGDAPELWFTPTEAAVYEFELRAFDGRHASLPATARVRVSGPEGAPPRAEAGYDQRAARLAEVSLNAAASVDPDTGPLSFRWRQIEGVHVPLSGAGAQARFVPIESGTYQFEVEVEDAQGLLAADRVRVVVDDAAGNSVPVPVAEVAGLADGSVELQALRSTDANGSGSLGYLWTQVEGPHVILSDPRAALASFVVPRAGLYGFELRVDDGLTRSPPMKVQFAADAAIAAAGRDQLVRAGSAVALDGSQSQSPRGGSLSFRWSQVGGPIDASLRDFDLPMLRLTPALSGYTLRFRLTVFDGQMPGVSDEVNVNVVDVPLAMASIDAEGGELVVSAAGSAWDGLKVTVPRGALGERLDLAIGEITRPVYQRDGRLPRGPALFLGPIGAQLLAPLRLSFPVGSALAEAGGRGEALETERFDHDSETWSNAGATIDEAASVASLEAPKPGLYQLTLPEPPPAGPDAGSPIDPGPPAPGVAEEQVCGCGAAGSAPIGGLALLALLAAGALRRRRAAAAALLATAVVGAPLTARATDPPHDYARLTNVCQDCHDVSHHAPGMAITTSAGNANLCLSCHNLPGNSHNWSTLDQARPGLEGSSHRWDAPTADPAHGSEIPLDEQMAMRLEGAFTRKTTCSTCHDQHKAIPSGTQKAPAAVKVASGGGSGTMTRNAPAAGAAPKSYLVDLVSAGTTGSARFRLSNDNGRSWFGFNGSWVPYDGANGRLTGASVALNDGTNVTVTFTGSFAVGDRFEFYVTYPMLRLANDASQMCEDCHRSMVQSSARATGTDPAYLPDGVRMFSHPVGQALAHAYDRTGGVLDANGVLQSAGDPVSTNDLVLKAGDGNRVRCMTCHHPHNADSNSLTEDAR